MIKTIFLLLITLILSGYGNAGETKIYAWKDKNGVFVFSDTPHKESSEVKLTNQNLTMAMTNTDISNKNSQPKNPVVGIIISSPEHNQAIRENTGTVYVTTRITPRFEHGFTIQLFIDGQASGPPSTNSTFALRDVARGEHALHVKLFNNKNEIIAVSQPCVFFMHREKLTVGI